MMTKIYGSVCILAQFLAYLQQVLSIDSRNIVFVIVSQTAFEHTGDRYYRTEDILLRHLNNYENPLDVDSAYGLINGQISFETVDSRASNQLKNDLNNQVKSKEQRHPIIHITNEDFAISGSWTIIPLLRPLLDKYEFSDVRWVLFIEPHTVVKYPKLIEALDAADRKARTMWTGYALRTEINAANKEYNNIHQELFAIGGLPFPYFASGFAMRIKLIHMLVHRKVKLQGFNFPSVMDPSIGLAWFVYGDENISGPFLKPNKWFCTFPGDDCATYPRKFDICGEAIPEESIYFAVKTKHRNHDTMVKLIRRTWGQQVSNLMFYSDVDDPSLPAIDTGVPKHCPKTIFTLKHAINVARNTPALKWIILIEDDALLGVKKLCEILSCYSGGENYTIIGSRIRVRPGQDFIYGGSGIVLSIATARLLSNCPCQYPELQDDFMLGSCATALGIPLSHSPLFYQHFPEYPEQEVLKRDHPVSFQGCSSQNMVECYDVYDQWLKADDIKPERQRSKNEL